MPVLTYHTTEWFLKKDYRTFYNALQSKFDQFWNDYVVSTKSTRKLAKYKSELFRSLCESGLDYVESHGLKAVYSKLKIIPVNNDYSQAFPDLVADAVSTLFFFPQLTFELNRENYKKVQKLISENVSQKETISYLEKRLLKYISRYWHRIPAFIESDRLYNNNKKERLKKGRGIKRLSYPAALIQALRNCKFSENELKGKYFDPHERAYKRFRLNPDKAEIIKMYKRLSKQQ